MANHPHLTHLKSGAIDGMHYDPKSKVLHLRFSSGDVWCYPGVSPEVAEGLRTAPSVGKYFHAHIRGKHEGTKVAD